MPKNCDKTIKMMKDAGCTGKRITKELIESRIESVDHQTITIAGQKMMFCGIRMKGGFVAVGKPATCIDPSNWRDEIGKEISYDNTFEELWKLEAYRLMADEYCDNGLAEVSGSIEMSFGEAVRAMKLGKKVARKGWNGVGMFTYHVPSKLIQDDLNNATYREHLILKTAQGDIATWAPSTSDALATDWVFVGEEY
ncbi:Gp49 family protein [Photobacterium damselae]|uniref:Gp49 family protein n=1 Tax=Photobacterium damselae TaxID=38293 RepID=UPI0040679462